MVTYTCDKCGKTTKELYHFFCARNDKSNAINIALEKTCSNRDFCVDCINEIMYVIDGVKND